MEQMTVKEILAIDLAKNYKDENTTVDEYYDGLQNVLKQDKTLEQVGNTLYIQKQVAPDVMEFHCANADSKANFIKNGAEYLQKLQNQNYKKAYTTYDDPRCEDFLKGFGFPYEIQKIDQGKNATYKAEVSL
jgi:hypothetical protein